MYNKTKLIQAKRKKPIFYEFLAYKLTFLIDLHKYTISIKGRFFFFFFLDRYSPVNYHPKSWFISSSTQHLLYLILVFESFIFQYMISFGAVIHYTFHHLNLSGKGCHKMCSFLQQLTNIHGFPTRNQLSKHINLVHLCWNLVSFDNPFLLRSQESISQNPMDQSTVSYLQKKRSAPRSSRPNSTSHGRISSKLYPMGSSADFLIRRRTKCCSSSDPGKRNEKSTSELGPCCRIVVDWIHGWKKKTRKERKLYS